MFDGLMTHVNPCDNFLIMVPNDHPGHFVRFHRWRPRSRKRTPSFPHTKREASLQAQIAELFRVALQGLMEDLRSRTGYSNVMWPLD